MIYSTHNHSLHRVEYHTCTIGKLGVLGKLIQTAFGFRSKTQTNVSDRRETQQPEIKNEYEHKNEYEQRKRAPTQRSESYTACCIAFLVGLPIARVVLSAGLFLLTLRLPCFQMPTDSDREADQTIVLAMSWEESANHWEERVLLSHLDVFPVKGVGLSVYKMAGLGHNDIEKQTDENESMQASESDMITCGGVIARAGLVARQDNRSVAILEHHGIRERAAVGSVVVLREVGGVGGVDMLPAQEGFNRDSQACEEWDLYGANTPVKLGALDTNTREVHVAQEILAAEVALCAAAQQAAAQRVTRKKRVDATAAKEAAASADAKAVERRRFDVKSAANEAKLRVAEWRRSEALAAAAVSQPTQRAPFDAAKAVQTAEVRAAEWRKSKALATFTVLEPTRRAPFDAAKAVQTAELRAAEWRKSKALAAFAVPEPNRRAPFSAAKAVQTAELRAAERRKSKALAAFAVPEPTRRAPFSAAKAVQTAELRAAEWKRSRADTAKAKEAAAEAAAVAVRRATFDTAKAVQQARLRSAEWLQRLPPWVLRPMW